MTTTKSEVLMALHMTERKLFDVLESLEHRNIDPKVEGCRDVQSSACATIRRSGGKPHRT